MLHGPNKLVVVLGLIASVFGLFASVITIYQALPADASIVDWLSPETLERANAWIRPVLESWPLGLFWSAILVYAIVTGIAIAADSFDEFGRYAVTLLLALPLFAFWLLVFWDIASTEALLWYAAGYAIVPWAASCSVLFVFFLADEYLFQPKTLTVEGRITDIESQTRHVLGRDYTDYTFVLERADDLPARVKYSPALFSGAHKFPTARSRVRLTGTWGSDGMFQATEYAVLRRPRQSS